MQLFLFYVHTETVLAFYKRCSRIPYDRMGFFGQQVTGLGGGYPGSTSYSTQAANTINPMMQLFGTGAALAGGIGNLASTFGFGGPR